MLIGGIALISIGSLALALGTAFAFLQPISTSLIISGAIVASIGISILLTTSFNWKHIAAYMLAIPLLSGLGIQWNSKINPKHFEERNCLLNNKLIGEMRHEQNTPVLELFTEDHYEMGVAQGYLMGAQIQEAFEQVLSPIMSLAGH